MNHAGYQRAGTTVRAHVSISYDPPAKTGTGVLPGTALLRERMNELFGLDIRGGYHRRCTRFHPALVGFGRCLFGHRISHHAECRALDATTGDAEVHRQICDWALGPEGQAWEIQEVITGFGPKGTPDRWVVGKGWAGRYDGPSDHRDHVHVSQTVRGSQRTEAPVAVVAGAQAGQPAGPQGPTRGPGRQETAGSEEDDVRVIEVTVRTVEGKGERAVPVPADDFLAATGPTFLGAVAKVGWRTEGEGIVIGVDDWFPGELDVPVRVLVRR